MNEYVIEFRDVFVSKHGGHSEPMARLTVQCKDWDAADRLGDALSRIIAPADGAKFVAAGVEEV